MTGAAGVVAPQEPGPEKPRVAVVTHVFAPSRGGAELYHELVAEALQRSAWVRVFTARLTSAPPGDVPAGSREPAGATAVPVERLAARRFLGENLIAPRRLLAALRGFDPAILWGNHPSITGDLAGLFALVGRRRWVATYHGDVSTTRWYRAPYTWWEAQLLRRADTVLVHAESYRDRLAHRGVPADRIVAVTPGPGIGHGHPPDVSAPGCDDRCTPGPDHPYLFVAGLDRARTYKRPELFLRALAGLRIAGVPVRAWIIGDGDRRAEIEGSAQELGLANSVEFLGWVSSEELARRYREAWALVLPSADSEGFGLVALEAVRYGCPVVSSPWAAAGPMLAAAGCAVVYSESDPQGLSSVLEGLWREPSRRHAMAARAREFAPKVSWDQALPQLTEAILRGPTRGPHPGRGGGVAPKAMARAR